MSWSAEEELTLFPRTYFLQLLLRAHVASLAAAAVDVVAVALVVVVVAFHCRLSLKTTIKLSYC